MIELPRSTGCDPDGFAQTEADHYGNCPVCGALLDMRDLNQMLAHVHDQPIVVDQGDVPPTRDAQ